MRISKNIKRKNRVLSNLSHIELSGCLFLRKKKKDRKKDNYVVTFSKYLVLMTCIFFIINLFLLSKC